MSYVIAILVFGFLIFFHELGHFIAARLSHVKIYEFAIGMGPKLVWWRSKKTGIQYALRMFPFGGFVSMQGELTDENPIELKEGEEPPTEDQSKMGSLMSKPAWQRLLVHVAGPFMNLLLGFICAAILCGITNIGTTTVAQFIKGEGEIAVSESQGLKEEDTIIAVGKHKVHISDELYYEIVHQGGTGEALDLTIIRDGEEMVVSVVFSTETESGVSYGDCDFMVYAQRKTFGSIIKQTLYKTKYMVQIVIESIFDLLAGKYSMDAVSGPVGTATVISDAVKMGFANFLYLVAIITVNLGIFNLLPLPALDGGHIFYTLLELITRRKLPSKIITIIDYVGLFILLGFSLIVTFNDILKFF